MHVHGKVASIAELLIHLFPRIMLSKIVQDMPVGLHGMFPVKSSKGIHLIAGGTSSGYSQSTNHLLLTL
jgi:hypothetical protein